jgi:hypothetical protein
LWKEVWNDPSAQTNGRNGQAQAGVDVFSQRPGLHAGIQCKQRDGLLRSKLTENELKEEVKAAEDFRPPLKSYVIATTGPRDAKLQECARLLSEANCQRGLFSVEVWSWQEIWPEIYKRDELLRRIGPVYWPKLAGNVPSRPKATAAFVALVVVLAVMGLVVFLWPRKQSKIPALSLPRITIETLDGLPEEFSGDSRLRQNRLFIRNNGESEILRFCSRLQLPEPIARTIETNATIGTSVGWRPLMDKLSIIGTGGRTEGGLWVGPTSAVYFVGSPPCFIYSGPTRGQKGTLSKAGDITGIWELTFDKLPPGGQVSLVFLTSNGSNSTTYLELASIPLWQSPPNPRTNPVTNELRFSLEGEYLLPAEAQNSKQSFLAPIVYDASSRKISSFLVQPNVGNWQPVTLTFQ